jgi:hypothetical protein
MAKNSGKPGGTSRIKFIMFDAEIADDQIQSVTQAITNALRGPAVSPPAKKVIALPANNGAEPHEIEAEAEEVEEEELAEMAPLRPRSSAPRKPAPTPEVLNLDFTSEPSLASFAAQHKAQESHQQRYLLAAAWFNDHRDITKVTPAHIYTAYRHMKWPLNLKDFSQPLRDLKFQKVMGSTEKGTYTINHLGLQRVAETKTATGE